MTQALSSKRNSMKRLILRSVLLPLFGITLLIGIASFAFTYHEIYEVYDGDLAHFAKVLRVMTEHEVREEKGRMISLGEEVSDISHKYEKEFAFAIIYKGKIAIRSNQLDGALLAGIPPGFSDRSLDGKKWRIFSDSAQEEFRVIVAENTEIRSEIILQILSSLFLPTLALFPFMLIVVFAGVRKSVSPLAALSATLDIRQVNDTAPIPASPGVTREIETITGSLNNMFSRIEKFMQREKAFIDDAAHELRTPLAAIRMQAQVLLRSEHLSQQDKEGMENLSHGIVRASNMVEKLLSFSRFQASPEMTDISLSDACAESAANLATLAAQSSLKLQLEIEPGVRIRGNHQAIVSMMDNIIGNAIKFSPAQRNIIVRVRRQQDAAIAEVIDDGPGIPAALKEKVFERFFRVAGQSVPGSGLGLAICKTIADAHHARLVLEDGTPSGLVVKIIF